jgi:formylglycine-generating enzyme required for sulfatase activity
MKLRLFHLTALLLATRSVVAAGSIEIPAWAFDRGNAKTFTNQWADVVPMVAFGGRSPVVLEYDIDFPASGNYALELRYASADPRPVQLLLDGKNVATVCRKGTGSWNTSGAQSEASADLYIPAGVRTVRLRRSADFPHLVSLRFTSSSIPNGWEVKRPKARKLDDPPPAPMFEPVMTEVDATALRLAIGDLVDTFGARYPHGPQFLKRLGELESAAASGKDPASTLAALAALRREALLLENPWIDFKRLLVVRRGNRSPDLGLPYNWQSNSSLPKEGYEDSVCALDVRDEAAPLTTVFKPQTPVFVGDLDLHWDGRRLLFSSVGTHRRWQVFELAMDGGPMPQVSGKPRQLTGEQPDVDSYDACYLPDGRILFTSTASFVGVPCVYGDSHVANIYRMDGDGRNIRQLCFDQEHDWCPTVLNNGRVLYTRWEYADTPHSNTRLLFHMNPDGTAQMEFLGSNSYWPNSFFYARPVPGHATMVAAIIGGHHDNPRMGELVLFDPARGRQESAPAIQRIPGRGKPVEAIIKDGLTLDSWPKFLHPVPLSDKYVIVSCKPTPNAPWGVYLVDVFDNLVPIRQSADAALLEPLPLRPTSPPPVLPDKIDPTRKDALVVIQDIYAGDGLRGVPRGTVRALRLFTYNFAYQGMGGLLGVVGAEGPWDVRRVLGTVPVEADGSAKFLMPANMPISMQPLDDEGKAMQLMRSWTTAMPGEVVQCTGCHERQNTAPLTQAALALSKPPSTIQPWFGPLRGFSYAREVQPVIDAHCVSCHNGQPREDGSVLGDLRGSVPLKNWSSVTPGNGGAHAGHFSVGYDTLNRFVRRNGIEGDYHVLEPMEFHADTTDLVQLLKKGHYGVKLDAEAWDRIITWIDMNCPFHGTWGEEIENPGRQRERRRELLRKYANLEDDPEQVHSSARPTPVVATKPAPASPAATVRPTAPGWPFNADQARRLQSGFGGETRRRIDLGEGVFLEFVRIPAGEFVMGSEDGAPDEQPLARMAIERPFWMAVRETENQAFARFDPEHDSGLEDKNAYQFGVRGYPANRPEQPVVRVSWNEAMAFCRWLSEKLGERVTLPTESQWEYACRAGASTSFSFGGKGADFSAHANLADATLSQFASDPYTVDVPLKHPTPFDDWIPKDRRFNDGALISVAPGRYTPNPWGLQDMHGNVAEWTRSSYAPYPYDAAGAGDAPEPAGRKVVRGGSWRDVPARATASFRLGYAAWQRIYNVGFRVMIEPGPAAVVQAGNLR